MDLEALDYKRRGRDPVFSERFGFSPGRSNLADLKKLITGPDPNNFQIFKPIIGIHPASQTITAGYFPALDLGRNQVCRFLFQGKALVGRRSG